MSVNRSRVHAEHEFVMDRVRLYLLRSVGSGENEVVCRDGSLIRNPVDHQLPDEAGLLLPADAWEDLVEYAAGRSQLGAENRVLREWLKSEAARIDVLMRDRKLS